MYVIMGGVFLGWLVMNDLLYMDEVYTFDSFAIIPAELSLNGTRQDVHGKDLVLKRCVVLERDSNMSCENANMRSK